MSGKRPSFPAFPLCRFTFADGRRCALPAHPRHHGLCYTHAHAQHRRLRPSDLARELQSPSGAASPEKIRRLLAKIPLAVADGTISPRDAGVMTYLCSVMLQACNSAANELPLPPVPDPAEWAFLSYLLSDDDELNDYDPLPSDPANG